MRVLIAPLEFKGTLTAREAAEAITAGLRRAKPDAELRLLPLADGGPGTLDALIGALPELLVHTVSVEDPLGRPVQARFAQRGEQAFLELAEAAGLHLLRGDERDVLRASTYGVGQLIRAALERGARDLVLGLGGSATNDGGAGALEALGVVLRAAEGARLPRGGAALQQLATVDSSHRERRIRLLTLATDVTSPLLGSTGASQMFTPQKGATPEQVRTLEAALAQFARIAGESFASVPGAGSAGGTAFGLMAIFGARIRPGFDVIAEAVALDAAIAEADVVVTGEGQLDAQSLLGKGPVQACRRASGKRVVFFTGVQRIEVPGAEVVLAPGPESTEQARSALEDAAANHFAR